MSHKHEVVIGKIFAHPMAANIDWKKLSSALEHFGARLDTSTHGRAKILLNGAELVISTPHHGHDIESKDDIMNLRHFLEAQGLAPKA